MYKFNDNKGMNKYSSKSDNFASYYDTEIMPNTDASRPPARLPFITVNRLFPFCDHIGVDDA